MDDLFFSPTATYTNADPLATCHEKRNDAETLALYCLASKHSSTGDATATTDSNPN